MTETNEKHTIPVVPDCAADGHPLNYCRCAMQYAGRAQGVAINPVDIARRFHDAYERLAPSFGYTTREDTRAFDPASSNGRLMIAVCAEILAAPPPCYRPTVDQVAFLARVRAGGGVGIVATSIDDVANVLREQERV